MNRAIGCIAFAVLLACRPHGTAEAQDAGTPWDTCLKAPVRACVLDEVLALALPVEEHGRRAALLGAIVEARAKAGDVDQALQVAKSIPDGQISRISAFRAIAEGQARAGRTKDAVETFEQALQLAYSWKDALQRAGLLHAIAEAQAETGATAAAAETFNQALQSAQSVRIEGQSGRMTIPIPETRLARLLKRMSTEQADAGQIAEALQTARSIKYDLKTRAEALTAVAAVQTKAALAKQAAATLDEALQSVREAHSSQEQWPSYRAARIRLLPPDGTQYIQMLCDVAKAQAGTGLGAKAAATLDEALQAVPTMQVEPPFKDWTVAASLTIIAGCQHEVGLTGAGLATLDRAVEAAGAVKDDPFHFYASAMAELSKVQAKVGLAGAAAATIDVAMGRARALGTEAQRTVALSNIARVQSEIGLTVEAGTTLDEALGFARSIVDAAHRGILLGGIAEEQVNAGLLARAEVTFGEALSSILSSQDQQRTNNLIFIIRGRQGIRSNATARLIAASAALRPQIVQAAQSIDDRLTRAEMLYEIAKALP